MKVVVADLRVTGNEHIVLNSAIIQGLKENKVEEIDFFAEGGHLDALAEAFPDIMSNTNPYPFHRHHYPNRIKTLVFRELLLPLKLIRVLLHARNAQLLLITTITPFGHAILNVFSGIFRPKTKCIALCHSELELLESKKRSLSRLAMELWKRTVSKRVNYVVLSPHIERNIKDCLPYRPQFSSIFHPFTSRLVNMAKSSQSSTAPTQKLRIGVPGFVRNDRKGAGNIFLLEERLAAAGRQDVELYLIGRGAKDFEPPSYTNVNMPFLDRSSPVPQTEFDRAISEMDIVLLMYQIDSYKFTASGAVLDALKFGQPVYATRNPLFDYMAAEGIFPGHLSDSIDSLFDEIVERLSIEKLEEKRNEFRSAMGSLIKRTDPKTNVSAILQNAN